MNVGRMAREDAYRWVEALNLSDDITVKSNHLNGYKEVLTKTVSKIELKNAKKNYDRMVKLGDKLDKANRGASPTKKVVVISVLAVGTFLVLRETGVLKNGLIKLGYLPKVSPDKLEKDLNDGDGI